MKVCFTGDLFLGGDIINSNSEQFVLSQEYYAADIRVSNLEQSFGSKKNRKDDKCTLYADPQSLSIAGLLKLDVAALSNNHIQDTGDDGIRSTIRLLKKNSISYFGAGQNIDEARAPYWIDNNTCVLGYCESGKPYLKKVQKATKNSPGVNPLSYDNILRDLNEVPDNAKAILHFHWGREHVALPEYDLIKLAKKLLAHEKVLCIIGLHAHRIQGVVKHQGKKAYMCIGNFIVPNFYIEPQTHIAYPKSFSEKVLTTKNYHFVGKLTYKKWSLKNRISLLVFVDIQKNTIHHIPMYQLPNQPMVKELIGFRKKLVFLTAKWYSLLYQLPKPAYIALQKANVLWDKVYKLTYSFIFLTRQNGLKWSVDKTNEYLRR